MRAAIYPLFPGGDGWELTNKSPPPFYGLKKKAQKFYRSSAVEAGPLDWLASRISAVKCRRAGLKIQEKYSPRGT